MTAKPIRVYLSPETHEAAAILKAQLGMRTMDAVISEALRHMNASLTSIDKIKQGMRKRR